MSEYKSQDYVCMSCYRFLNGCPVPFFVFFNHSVQQAMAGMDLRGKESDVIMWDSSMTEKSQELHTFFMKTALISGNRAPFLMSYYDLREFGKVAKADVGYHGEGWNGPETCEF